MCAAVEDILGDYPLKLTDATTSLVVPQIFQLDFRADLSARALKPVQENAAGFIEGVHGSVSGVCERSGGCD